jgi:hypothetical protein
MQTLLNTQVFLDIDNQTAETKRLFDLRGL